MSSSSSTSASASRFTPPGEAIGPSASLPARSAVPRLLPLGHRPHRPLAMQPGAAAAVENDGLYEHHYTPCVDFDGDGSQKHHERSCPRSLVTCLVSLPKEYKLRAPWPERKENVWYGNVGHPRLSSYAKDHSWLNRTGEHLVFPPDESEFKGGARHYIDTIDEMAPDLDWGKNIRIALDIGCKSAGFGVALLEKAHEL
ncbi:hypothetical protein ZWY2020_016327 [Hordeum vulgare]|nr:hypothetical protein ZWY2020_016327 [Hordeum vulgare]